MALRTIKTIVAGLLSLQRYESDFEPSGIGSPNLKRDENATVLAVQSIVDKLTGPSGTVANFTYTVATLAARPAVNAVPNGTLIFVESQKSWYWTDLGSNTYRRIVQPNPAWMAQAAWGIDTVNGNDENDGSVANPLRTWAELGARLPMIDLGLTAITITIAAGSAFGAGDPMEWQPVLKQSTGPQNLLTIVGVRTLGANRAVASSSDEAGNAAPLVDAGVALTVGTLIQATSGAQSGATAVVLKLIAGTQYRTTKWRSAAGSATAPPAPTDTIATVALPTVALFSFASPNIALPFVQNLSIAAVDFTVTNQLVWQTCIIAGTVTLSQPCLINWDGCSLNANPTISLVSPGIKVISSLCGFIRTGLGPLQTNWGGRIGLTNCVVQGGSGSGIVARESAQLLLNHVGIFDTTTSALDVYDRAWCEITTGATLYGSGNAGKGTRVFAGGTCQVQSAVVPTLASVGQELELENAPTAIPALAGGAAVPAASALTNWAQWIAGPFSRKVVDYSANGSITTLQ